MTFGPWICSRIVVFVPATKKRRRTSLSSSFLLWASGASQHAALPSLTRSEIGTRRFSCQSWCAWKNADGISQRDHLNQWSSAVTRFIPASRRPLIQVVADGISQRDHLNQWSSACRYKTGDSLNTRPSADLRSVLNQFASYCRSYKWR